MMTNSTGFSANMLDRLVLAMLCLVSLSACELSNKPADAQSVKITRQTPAELGSFATQDLRAVVNIGNFASNLLGNDVINDEWSLVIDGDLTENRTYSVNVKWYAFDSLVLEEVGSVITDTAMPNLTINLDYFLNSGPVRFDDDCDGRSNFDELTNGSDHTSPGFVVDNTCSNLVTLPEDMQQLDQAEIVRNYDDFQTIGFTNQLQSFHQALRIGKVEVGETTHFQSFVKGNFVSTGNFIEATLRLYQHESGARGVGFGFWSREQIDDVQQAHSACYKPDNSSAIWCALNFQWDTHQWYRLQMNRTAERTWEAWVVNETSDERTKIGTITTSQAIQWEDAEFSLDYATRKPYSECTNGLDSVAVQHKHAVLNGDFELRDGIVYPSLCLEIGGGWGAGTRELNNETQFSMSIGRL